MDKIRAIKRRKEQDIQNKQAGGSGPRKNDLRFRVQQQNGEDENDEDVDEFEDISELDDKEIERLNRKLERNDSDELAHDESSEESEDEGEANYYKENIFNKEDFYLYRAVLNIYAQEYGKAITDFETCSNIMHQNKVLYPKNKFPDADLEGYESPTGEGNVNGENDDNASQGSSQTDLSDVGLCSLNIHEFSFNIALSLMLSGDYKKALTKMDYIISTIAKKYVNQLWLLRGILNDILGYADQSAKDIKRAYKYDR
jgi:TolA-binding protein